MRSYLVHVAWAVVCIIASLVAYSLGLAEGMAWDHYMKATQDCQRAFKEYRDAHP